MIPSLIPMLLSFYEDVAGEEAANGIAVPVILGSILIAPAIVGRVKVQKLR